VAFAARDAAGSITNLSLRFVPRHPGEEPPEERKTVTLRGRTVRDCAFVRPGFFEIGDDPGAIADAVLFCEGGPDSLAWDLLLAESKPVTWVLGVIGAGIAGSVVRSFASHLKGRHVRLALDDDAAGEGAIPEAASAAWAAGARRVSRVTLEGAKDAAELVEKEAAHV
jgi:hypothetical protein